MYSTFDLNRYVAAQEDLFSQALNEIRNGLKESHWMWFIFPQIDGLGFSPLSRRYSIKSRAEAIAFLQHSILGPRLREITEALLELEDKSAREIFGETDTMKLKSCMTLFALVSSNEDSLFQKVLDKYFGGQMDEITINLLKD